MNDLIEALANPTLSHDEFVDLLLEYAQARNILPSVLAAAVRKERPEIMPMALIRGLFWNELQVMADGDGY